MANWIIKNHGLMVNLYQIMKMLDYETIEVTKGVLKEEYDIIGYTHYKDRYDKSMTFGEYVNAKRHWIACILGESKYA